jgi:hypothetical protein
VILSLARLSLSIGGAVSAALADENYGIRFRPGLVLTPDLSGYLSFLDVP